MRLLAIPGSLRRGSRNRQLLGAAVWELPAHVDLTMYEWLRGLPPYDEDDDGAAPPPPVVALRQAIAGADAILIATPEYNHSIPGQLKNALDWASRPWPSPALADKPVAVIGASASPFGAVWAQAETRKVLTAIGADVLDAELPVAHADTAFRQDARLADEQLRQRLAAIIAELVAAADGALGSDADVLEPA